MLLCVCRFNSFKEKQQSAKFSRKGQPGHAAAIEAAPLIGEQLYRLSKEERPNDKIKEFEEEPLQGLVRRRQCQVQPPHARIGTVRFPIAGPTARCRQEIPSEEVEGNRWWRVIEEIEGGRQQSRSRRRVCTVARVVLSSNGYYSEYE